MLRSSIDGVFPLLLTSLVKNVKECHGDEDENHDGHDNRRDPKLIIDVSIRATSTAVPITGVSALSYSTA